MKRKALKKYILPFLIITIIGCQSEKENAKKSLMETFEKMGNAITNGDLDAFTSHYSDSPLHLPPGATMNSTKEEIRDFLKDKLDLYNIEEEPTIKFSDDASMAYVFGIYTTKADTSQNLESVGGRFITIWERNDKNQWECVVDIWNSDDPRFAHL